MVRRPSSWCGLLWLSCAPAAPEPTAGAWAEIEVEPSGLTATRSGESLTLQLESWGRAQHRIPLDHAAVSGCGPSAPDCRVEQAYDGLIAWVEPGARSVRQGWDLHHRPHGAGAVVLELEVIGASPLVISHDAARLQGAGLAWRYDGLTAWDTDGDVLPARFVAVGQRLRIEVDDTGARWPIYVDPDLSAGELSITASDGAAGDGLGAGGLAAGDLDADGVDELILGAAGRDVGGTDVGAVYVVANSITGPSTEQILGLDLASADGDGLGEALTTGDLDGDGDDDLIVGAPGRDDQGVDAGAVHVFLGDPLLVGGAGLSVDVDLFATDGRDGDRFGAALTTADLNGDGAAELIVAAPGQDAAGADAGAVYVYTGGSGGLSSASELRFSPSDLSDTDTLGAVGGAGDLDGDGFAELALGAPGHDHPLAEGGAVWVYRGSSAGVDSSSEVELSAPDLAADDQFGAQVVGAGDTNGDGYDDLLATAPGHDDLGLDAGAAYLYAGSATGVSSSVVLEILASDGAAGAGLQAGAGAGDVNGDGFADVVLGAAGQDTSAGADAGSMYLFYGAASGLDRTSEVVLVAVTGVAGEALGTTVGGGDLDGDGLADLFGGAGSGAGLVAGAGRVVVFPGGCVDADGDGHCAEDGDCDDADANLGPDAVEVCDSGDVDEDCDGLADDADPSVDLAAATLFYLDADSDGAAGTPTTACDAPVGSSTTNDDCDDTDPTGAVLTAQSRDNDGDGFGSAAGTTMLCGVEAGYAPNADDCNDGNAAVNPDAPEVDCDGMDNNCDGIVSIITVYQDADGDGYGDESVSSTRCEEPDWVEIGRDCDDTEPRSHPGYREVACDEIDNDCDGQIDENADYPTFYRDADGDGYGDPDVSEVQCGEADPGWVANNEDCNDRDPNVSPGEIADFCDYIDNDCNGYVDDLGIHVIRYPDEDGDGQGDPSRETGRCLEDSEVGWSSNNDDCDDSDPTVYAESGNDTTCDGVDNDCDGGIDGSAWYPYALCRDDTSLFPDVSSGDGCAEAEEDTDGPCCGGAALLLVFLARRARSGARRRAGARGVA